MQNRNTKKTVTIIVIIIAIIGIALGVSHHKSHMLDGTWIVKTADGESKTGTANLIKLKIDGKKFSTGDGNYSGKIERDSKQKKLTFVTTKNRGGSDKPTNTAIYSLSDSKDELTLDFTDNDDILDGYNVILVKSSSQEGKTIQEQTNKIRKEFAREQDEAKRDTEKTIKILKGKTLVPTKNVSFSAKELEAAAKKDEKDDSSAIDQISGVATRQNGVKIPQSIQFSSDGKRVTVKYNKYVIKTTIHLGSNDETYNAKVEKGQYQGKVDVMSKPRQDEDKIDTTVTINNNDKEYISMKYNLAKHILITDSDDTGIEISYKVK